MSISWKKKLLELKLVGRNQSSAGKMLPTGEFRSRHLVVLYTFGVQSVTAENLKSNGAVLHLAIGLFFESCNLNNFTSKL
jgi:hypothetical protein